MNWKFSMIDDDTEEIIGFFNELIIKENQFWIEDFQYNQSIRKKVKVHNVYIAILDREQKVLGKYFLSLSNYLEIDSLALLNHLELHGEIEENIHQSDLEFWGKLRSPKKEEHYDWLSLSPEGRKSWMNIVRIHSQYNQNRKMNSEKSVVIDGNYITDPLSFYLTLGEVINGYGGYYGEGLDSLADCLCGGFGIDPPFELQCLHFRQNPNLNAFCMIGTSVSKNNSDYFTKVVKLLEAHNVAISIVG